MSNSYAKPELRFNDVPKWFKDIRNSSDFMPTKMNLKPMSYDYMALLETPNRSQVYSPASTQKSQIGIGTQFHRPTENVAKAIASNHTVWQDIKNLGGTVAEHGGNLLGRTFDLISRTGYAIRNQYLENAKINYMTPGSAGGTKMTGFEHLQAVFDVASSPGYIRRVARGQLDDTGKALWMGLSGKAKTSTSDILAQTTPGWWEKNKNTKKALAVGITGDILIDPLTWMTMGLNPGSVSRAGLGVGKLVTFDKAGAMSVFRDTVFTPTGLKQSAKTMKSDMLQANVNKWHRKEATALKRGDKAAANFAKGKKVTHTQQYYTAKAAEFSQKAADAAAEDLKGAALAMRMVKRNLNPLTAMQTASRFTTGAKAGSDILRGQTTIAAAANSVYDASVTAMMNGENAEFYDMVYQAVGHRDFEYSHAGVKHVVKFSEAKSLPEFLKMIVQEGAPVAAYAENSARALRSRKGRIYSTEARGNQFQKDWTQHMFKASRDSVDPSKWDAVRADMDTRWATGKRRWSVGPQPLKNLSEERPELPIIREEDFLDGKHSWDDLAGEAKKQWDETQKAAGTRVPWKPNKGAFIMVDAEGNARVVGIRNLRDFNERQARNLGAPMARAAAAEARSPEQVAVDTLTGVSDDLAGRRDLILEEQARLIGERDALNAELANMSPEDVKNLFGVEVVDGVVRATRSDNIEESIPAIVQAVLADRVNTRLDDTALKAAGYSVGRDETGKIQLAKTSKGTPDPNDPMRDYTQDVHGEMGLAMMDAWSAAIRYAADQELLADPKNFDMVMDILYQHSETFINLATADAKLAVMNLMRNAVGMQFPEGFVPNATQLTEAFGDVTNSSFKFLNAKGEAVPGTQTRQWENLAKEIRNWTRDALPFLDKDTPIDEAALLKVNKDVDAVRKNTMQEYYDRADEAINTLTKRVRVLGSKVSPKDFNATGVAEVGNYRMLDFLMHTSQILNAQRTRFVYHGKQGTGIVRLNMGRLSALDSFGAVDDETLDALKALAELKELAKRDLSIAKGEQAVKISRARQELSILFAESGGLEQVARVENINRTDFSQDFATLGSHARLKQGVVSDRGNGGFGAKYAADLMEHVWGAATLNHEWMKALHHRILSGVVVEGRTQKQVATDIIKNVDEFFKNHERIKKQLYPVFNSKAKGLTGNTTQTVRKRGKELQQNWGTPNEILVDQNSPVVLNNIGAKQVYLPGGKTEFAPEEFQRVGLASNGKPWEPAKLVTWLRDQAKKIDPKVLQTGDKTGIRKWFTIGKDADGKPKVIAYLDPEMRRLGDKGSNQGMIIRHKGLPGSARVNPRPPQLYYLTPEGDLIQLGNAQRFDQVDEINAAFKDILTDTPEGARRHDPTLQGEDYRPGAHVLEKGVKYNRAKTEKVANPEYAAKQEQIAALDTQINDLQAQADAIPSEGAAMPEGAVDEGIPTGDVDPDDVVNTSPNDYTPEEMEKIRQWIDESYGDRSPEEIGKALYGHTMALAYDMALTKAHVTTGLRDLSIKQHASIRFAGMPFMNAPNVMNATHNTAGVTATAMSRSRAQRFWANIINPQDRPDHWTTGARRKFTRESHLLEGTLMQIRRKAVNSAAMSRKVTIHFLNNLYPRVTKGEYNVLSMAGLSKRQRYAKASQALFDPANVADPNGLSLFDQVDGSNPLKDIEADFERLSFTAFGDAPHELGGNEWKDKVSLFNKYLPKKFQFTPDEIDAIYNAGITENPFSRQWLSDVGTVMPLGSKMNTDALQRHNLAELHYALSDSALKIEEGRDLYRGIWDEFSFEMEKPVADYINNKVQPVTLGVDGKPMRGKIINLEDLGEANDFGIPTNRVPAEFRDGSRYVDASFLPEIATLMRFMDGTDALNKVIDTSFLDKVLQYFKASVTIYKVPTYPVRNMMADVFMSAMDGLTQPKYYKWAAQVMQNSSRVGKEIDQNSSTYQQILDRNFLGEELQRAAHDPVTVADPQLGPGLTSLFLKTADGQEIRLNDAQLMHLFDELGLGQNQIVGEVSEALAAARLTTHGQAAGKLHDALRSLNDWRESWARMAHFMYALEREAPLGGNLADIAKRASERVVKNHFDYNDVSIFERAWLARWIPFYKWVRNVIPYTIASVVTKPYMLKIEQGLQEGLHGLSDDSDDPRTDFVVPEYIRRERAVDVGSYSDPQGNMFMQWASINLPLSETLTGTFAPTLDPLIDPSVPWGNKVERMGAGLIRTSAAMSNPLVKAYIQGSTDEVVWPHGSQAQRQGQSWMTTAATMIPGVPMYESMKKSVKDYTKPGQEGMNATAALLKELGMIGLTNNSESAQVGEVKRIQDLNEAKRDTLKAELAKKIEKKYPQTTPAQRMEVVNAYIESMRQ